MLIELSQSAEKQLQSKKLVNSERIVLVYDSEGCGCAVSGVAALWIADGEIQGDEMVRAQSNTDTPIYYLSRHEVFFEEKLRIDYREDRRSFALTSDNQIYGMNVGLTDRRSAAPMPSGVRQ
ncbi:iron-sulfur cluster biosynthesis family protein [Paenibacillus alkalitolerans]|uniref:iron-sulfur cluster biosynthesis family protein n=1 Tax=Paenibacillus alkalitolerans TaxID=2799335 RepID=UPI0018F2C659|nr:iron-sulfur cluster biosynthesis family protein [Paenibacillus alkalitolerans]